MAAPSDPQIPDELRSYLDMIADRLFSGHAAVMVGAGFSINAAAAGARPGFLNWPQLGNRFYRRLHGHAPGRSDMYLQVPTLAHQVEAAFGRPALDQMLRDAIPDLKYRPSALHTKLLELPWSDVFTTNYDTLLERARRSVISQRYDLVLKPEDLGRSNRPRIVKLHGSLPSDGPFIVTDEDYRRYPNDFAPFVNAVRQALLENTFCLIGFSGDDPNFLQWVGWIQDKLGLRNSPKIYLVGLLNLSASQKTLLERRNITPVDMSVCPHIGSDHYLALNEILSYFQLRQAQENRLDWPGTRYDQPVLSKTSEPSVIVERWRSQRCKYPGWVILPEDLRTALWLDTDRHLEEVPTALPPALDLDFAFELVWRLEKCLCPIFDNLAAVLEATIDRYWAITATDGSLDSLAHAGNEVDTRGLTLDDIRHRCHYLLLAMMRYYREEGLTDKWDAACERIQTILPAISPELTAQFHFERSLSALFALNIPEFKSRLLDWPENRALPFWSARKAGLLAEVGELSDAQRILEQSLEAIRIKLNLNPTTSDYTLLSQESLVMCLTHVLRRRSLVMASSQQDTQGQFREVRMRWHVLKQYKCDPWQEIETFEHKLRCPPHATPNFATTPTFDIGRSVQTHHIGPDKEALTAYNFLRFSEDAGLPFRISNMTLATKTAAGTLPRIARYSSYWALATLVRIGDENAVDEIFDRPSVARMDRPTVDSLIERYLDSLRWAAADIAMGDPRRQPNFGTLIAGVVPEILSRLCCKSSWPCRKRIVDWLLDVYRSEHLSKYDGVRHLVTRLIESSSAGERVAMIPKLLEFPIPANLDVIEQSEYPNPFDFLDLRTGIQANASTVRNKPLEGLFSMASSDQAAGRIWAVSSLGQLQAGGLLGTNESERFAAALWSRVDGDDLPSGTNYYRFAFLSLPHPAGVDPTERFRRYVRRARFPAQDSRTTTAISGSGDCYLCRDIYSARDVRWSRNDLRMIIDRLVEWWDSDKEHWRGTMDDNTPPAFVSALKNQFSDFVRTITEMVVRHANLVAEESIRSNVVRVAKECRAFELPALQLEIACAYVFGWERDTILARTEDAMASSEITEVIEALEAMGVVSEHWASQTNDRDLMFLLRRLAQMVRWRNGTALWATLASVQSVVKRHPWAFVDVVERDVLMGLSRLISESSVGAGSNARFDERGSQSVSTKLIVRRAAVRLAYSLFEHYQAQGNAIPQAIGAWEEMCRSDDEFLDIRREWLSPCNEQTSIQR